MFPPHNNQLNNRCKRTGYLEIGLKTWHILWERERNVLTMHSTHFIYGYMASDIWLRTILIVRKKTCCHIGYSYRLTARVLLYAPSHRQDNTYHSLCYISRGALARTRNSSMGISCGSQRFTTVMKLSSSSKCDVKHVSHLRLPNIIC